MGQLSVHRREVGLSNLRALVGWSAVLFLARVVGAVATYGSQIMIARWLGAEALGHYVLAFSALLIASVIATGGFAEGAPRFVGIALSSADGGVLKGYVRRARQATVLGATCVAVLGIVLTLAVLPPSYHGTMTVAFMAVPLYALVRLHSSVAQGLARLTLREVPNSVVRPVAFGILIAVAWLLSAPFTASALMLLQCAIVAVVSCFLMLRISSLVRREAGDGPAVFRDALWFKSAPSLVVAGAFYMYLPELVNLSASPFLTPDEIAHLNAALRTGMLIMFAIHAIDSAFLPRATKLFATNSQSEMERWVLLTACLKVLATGGAFLFFLAASEPILGLFGPGFVAAAPALQIFVGGLLLRTLIAPPLQLVFLSDQQSACIPASLGSLCVLIVGAYFLVPTFGVSGAALSAVLSMAIWSSILIAPARAGLGFHASPLVWSLTRLVGVWR